MKQALIPQAPTSAGPAPDLPVLRIVLILVPEPKRLFRFPLESLLKSDPQVLPFPHGPEHDHEQFPHRKCDFGLRGFLILDVTRTSVLSIPDHESPKCRNTFFGESAQPLVHWTPEMSIHETSMRRNALIAFSPMAISWSM
jgi:hypothetical protein